MPELTVAEKETRVRWLGDFEVLGKIGQGGIANIFLGRQKSLDRLVAIKILSPAYSLNPEIVRRFEEESKIIARLRHPHIVHVIDAGREGDQYYFAMDLIEGTTFRKMLDDKAVPLSRKFTVVIQALKALDYAHKNGVIHRDIKPSNILIDKSGNALVVDFGIAQIIDREDLEKTRPGVVMGSLNYMSPEQKLCSTSIDHTTDIYAVGVILYELLTGRRPQGNARKPSELSSAAGPELDRIVMKCLEPNPRDRYQSAARLKDDLLSAVHKKSIKLCDRGENGGSLRDYVGRLSFLDALSKTKNTATYLVEDRQASQMYVIKIIHKSEGGIKEARILKALNFPGFVKIVDAAANADRSLILMGYARGGSLEDRLVRAYPPQKALRIFRSLASALEYAHKNDLIHGNLSPANILFDESDNLILTDFGQAENHKLGRRGCYAAPEKKKTKLSDIYSAGAILHRLLTNQVPIFDSYLRLIWQESYPKLPISLKMLMSDMLRNGPGDRPKNFAAVLARLEECERDLEKLGKADTGDLPEISRKPLYRPKVVLALLIIVLMGVLVLFHSETLYDLFLRLTSR